MELNLHLLNPEQRQAVEHIDGPLLILAGAGSGKTRVITHRIGYLIDQGVAPDQILAVSFTNKAAQEMRERVGHLIGTSLSNRVHLSTFHSLGLDILKKHIEKLGYRRTFTILDQGDQISLVKDVLKDLKLDPSKVDPSDLLFLISRAKMAFLEPSKMPEFRYHPLMPFAQKTYRHYQAALRGLNAVDFDDLICLPVRLFEEHEKVRRRYASHYKYVMVDEYQDTNHTQLMFMEAIVREHQNICVVGDDDQSIYAFRGAVSGNILQVEKTFKNTRVIKLEQNYRSTNGILRAANALIANNSARKEKNLWSNNGDGDPITMVESKDEREEAEYVAAEIEALRFHLRLNYRDFAVLFRVNPQARLFEEAFRTYNIPYQLVGAAEFFDRKEVKDFIAFLKACLNPEDEVSMRRIVNVPPRGIGTQTVEKISVWAAEHQVSFFEALKSVSAGAQIDGMNHASHEHLKTFIQLIENFHQEFNATTHISQSARSLLHELNFVDYLRSAEKSPKVASRRIENVQQVLASIAQFESRAGGTLDGFLTRIILDQSSASKENEEDAVQCMTLHASKGLEFPVVFMVGLEEGYLPHERSLVNQAGIEEERRLAYVGVTRAQKKLYLSLSAERSRFGKKDERSPSRFLSEIPKEMIDSNMASLNPKLREMKNDLNLKYLEAMRAQLFSD
ncbi:AAA family ATPase [Microvenator marinus]|uniref:DNA 3'-5' helicase n=1 Tax=Microvenator marinus TaxID=2600177 RepID=A0A5B8XMR7_9DELT|nr:UvrD-helicase domain-containing protein [Microvenator marinus]QED26481.1 AAA family ATPase [Microvenator marinus]